MKRIRPAPMGRAYRYQRRISHLEIVLAEKASGNGKAALATTVATAKPAARRKRRRRLRPRRRRKKKAPAKKFAGKKTARSKKK